MKLKTVKEAKDFLENKEEFFIKNIEDYKYMLLGWKTDNKIEKFDYFKTDKELIAFANIEKEGWWKN